MVQNKYSSAATGLLVLSLLAGCPSEQPNPNEAGNKDSDETAPAVQVDSQIVQEIIEIATPPTDAEAERTTADDFWLPKMDKAEAAFAQIIVNQDHAALCEAVSAFGKHGPYTDFVILYGATGMNTARTPDYRVLPITEDKFGISGEDYGQCQLAVCRCWVEVLLDDPDLLSRYYLANLWNEYSRLVARAGFIKWAEETEKGFKEGDPNRYWWYARNALLLMEATRKTDLLKGAKPEDVGERFKQWMQWFNQTSSYLIPNQKDLRWDKAFVKHSTVSERIRVPSPPFLDWKGDFPTHDIITWGIFRPGLAVPDDTRETGGTTSAEQGKDPGG